jgi:hypothetical protein
MFKRIQKSLKVAKEGETNVIEKLYEQPKKEKSQEMPHYKNNLTEPNSIYQADLLQMPEDKGYNYLLVVVDTITGITDAEPLKNKEAETTLAGFKKIFARSHLKLPASTLHVDPGPEFKSVVSDYFKEKGIMVRVGKVDRSRQQALAENRNKIIAKALFQKQVGQELVTKKPSTEWVDDVKKVIDAINEHEKEQYKKRREKIDKQLEKGPLLPILQAKVPILALDTKVRIKLDKPRGVLGEKLHGTFRATDIKWDPDVKTITNIILTPMQPVMYQVDRKKTAYTRQQLQVVEEDEKPVPKEILKKQQKEVQKAESSIEQAIPEVMDKAIKKISPKPPTKIEKAVENTSRSGRAIKPKKFFGE